MAPTTTIDPAIGALEQQFPNIPDYTLEDFDPRNLGDVLPVNLVPLEFGPGWTMATRGVTMGGTVVASLSVIVASGDTAAAWANYVNDRHDFSWAAISNEIALNAGDDSGWIGVWYHNGYVWSVSGPATVGRAYADALVEQQAATGSETEPEQADINALEGPLAALAVDVPGFQYADQPHQQLVDILEQMGPNGCEDHVSMHSVHPADDPDPIHTIDEADLGLTIVKWSPLSGCGLGLPMFAELQESGSMQQTTIQGLSALTDGKELIWLTDSGVGVDAFASSTATLKAYQPLLNAIAEASKNTPV